MLAIDIPLLFTSTLFLLYIANSTNTLRNFRKNRHIFLM
jgi:hypothetical protein